MRRVEVFRDNTENVSNPPLKDLESEELTNRYVSVIDRIRHYDDEWFEDILKANNLFGKKLNAKRCRLVVLASLRKSMESKSIEN